MTHLADLVKYHDNMAEAASFAASGAGMAKGKGFDAQADKHRAWATFLRSLQPPTQTSVPKLRRHINGGPRC